MGISCLYPFTVKNKREGTQRPDISLVKGFSDRRYLLLFIVIHSERFSRVGAVACFDAQKCRINVVHRRRSGLVRHRHVPGAALAVLQARRVAARLCFSVNGLRSR